jgi:uncharacterized protein (TIGR03382 family)
MRTRRLARAAVVALTVAAVGPPAASAGDIVQRRDGSKAVYVPANATPDRTTAEDGLQWDDAAFGAGATAAFAVACAAALSSRRRHRLRGLHVEATK